MEENFFCGIKLKTRGSQNDGNDQNIIFYRTMKMEIFFFTAAHRNELND